MAEMESPILLELQSDLQLLLEQKGGSVEDGSLVANNLCMTLESGFRHGLIRESRESTDFFDVVLVLFDQQNTYGRPKGCEFALPINICKSISFVCGVKCLYSSKGRGRLLLRCALNGKWLSSLVKSLQSWSDIGGHYHDESLIRSSDKFCKTLADIQEATKFCLQLDNFAFLDTTWDRPTCSRHELVPCKDLGLMVCAIEGHIIVTKVKPYSVAGEDDKVEVGDYLVSIDSVILFDMSPEFIAKMIKKMGGRVPISITVAKAKHSKNKIYPPLVPFLKCADLDTEALEQKWAGAARKTDKTKIGRAYSCPTNDLLNELKLSEIDTDTTDDEEVFNHGASKKHLGQSGFPLTYLGSLQIDRVGDTSFLDWAIRKVLTDSAKVEHEISLHLLELNIKLYCKDTGELVLQYPYPKISACGCNSTDPRYMAFIGGDNLCRLAKNFLCHVFYAEDARISREIVHHMANGFERTLTTA